MAFAGTAYVKVQPDFTLFNTQMAEKLRGSVDQKVNLKLDDKTGNVLNDKFGKPITQTVGVNVDQKTLDDNERKIKSSSDRIGNLIKGALAFGAAGAAAAFVKSSVSAVTTLYESSMKLHMLTGMNLNQAGQWVAVTSAMGISSQKLTASFKILDTQFTSAMGGSKAAMANFKALGITQDELNATGGDTAKIFELVNQHLATTAPSAAKTTAEFKLLGRGAAALTPILQDGGKEFDKLVKFAGSLGINLGNTAKGLEQARDAQFKWNIAVQAAQLFVVNKLIPAFMDIGKWLNQNVIPPVRDVVHWFDQHKQVTEGLAKGLAALVVIKGLEKIASPIVALGTAMSSAIGLAGKLKGAIGLLTAGEVAAGAAGAGTAAAGAGTAAGAGAASTGLVAAFARSLAGPLAAAVGVAVGVYLLQKGPGAPQKNQAYVDPKGVTQYAGANTKTVAPNPFALYGEPGYQPHMTQAQITAALLQAKKDGQKIAKALADGWAKYTFPDQPQMFRDFLKQTKNETPPIRAAGAQAVLAYTQGLESKGQLPKGATQKMLDQMKASFPELTRVSEADREGVRRTVHRRNELPSRRTEDERIRSPRSETISKRSSSRLIVRRATRSRRPA